MSTLGRRSWLRAALCAFAMVLAASASADTRKTTLFRKGAWEALLYQDDELGVWCGAETRNHRNQMMALAGMDTGMLVVLFTDPRWGLRPRDVDFLVDIDYARWRVRGRAEDQSVMVVPQDAKAARRFFRELQKGFAVALRNADGERLAVFSLRGSSATLARFLTCWEAIVENRQRRNDPFGETGTPGMDPF